MAYGQKKIREVIPITTGTNYVKYLVVALFNQVKDLYNMNSKYFKYLEEEGINIVKIVNLPKAIHRIIAILIKFPTSFLQTMKKQYSTSYAKNKNPA